MGSADKNGKSGLSRRNTFQRMLDLEKRNKVCQFPVSKKQIVPAVHVRAVLGVIGSRLTVFGMQVNRMQAPLTTVTTVSTTTNNAPHNRNANFHTSKRPPATLQTTDRAMTSPTLSLSIPKTQVSKDGTTTKYVIKDGNVIPQDEAVSEGESDRSSICRSPGWDNESERKRKKEKQEAKQQRKMEKKKLETEEKHAQKMKNRLSKPPPTNKKLSKMVFPTERSSSSPAVPTVAGTSEGSKKSPGERSRRGSIEMGFKSWIQATQAIPVLPWNSSRTTPTDTTPTKTRPPSRDSGFIGGLRLRLSEDAAFPDKVRKQLLAEEQQVVLGTLDLPPSVSASTSVKDNSADNSIRQTIVQSPPTSIYEELVRTPQQWDAIYAQAGRMANASQTLIPVADDVPIMQRNIKKTYKASQKTSVDGYFPAQTSVSGEGSSKRESSSSSKVRALGPTNAGESSSQGGRSSSTPSNERPLHSRNGSGNRPNTTGSGHIGSYVMNQRRQSQDVAISTFVDECRVSNTPDSEFSPRGRAESFHTVKSHASTEEVPTVKSRERSNDPHPLIREAYAAPQLFLEKNAEPQSSTPSVAPPVAPSTISSHERRTSKGLRGLKDVARAAFSRQSAPNSPVDNDLVNPDIIKALTAPRRTSENQNSTAPTTDGSSGRAKAGRILGENITQSPQSTKPPPLSGHLADRPPIPNRSLNRDSSPIPLQIKKSKGPNARVRPGTDSSEEYSTFDDSSNVTTPIPSTPNSHKQQPSGITKVGFHSRGNSSERNLPRKGKNPVMPGDNGAMNRSQDSWSRTAMPVDMTDDEENSKTPTAIHQHPLSDLQKAVEITKAEIEAGLQRQPSLSRSISTPELQDLSFLPPLKHQSLRPQNGKQKASSSTPQPRPSSPTTMIKPPALQTKSEGSSPTFPTSSQHLRSARNNLPQQNPGMPPPIAKMFVECCSCHYFHDMPSKIYACMAKPVSVVEDKERGVHGVVETSVKCPWCGHGMRTTCCAGWAGVLCLRERLH